MASSTNKNTLTAEELIAIGGFQDRFKEADFFGIKCNAALSNWQTRSSELTTARLQPYNDLLFKHITRTIDTVEISRLLVEKCKVAENKMDLCVPIWEFKHHRMPFNYRHDPEGFQHTRAVSAGDADAKYVEAIYKHGFRDLVGAVNYDEWYGTNTFRYPLMEVDRVFRKTDLKERLALHFGGLHFSISVREHCEVQTIDGVDFYPLRCEVVLNYYPYEMPPFKFKQLGGAAVKYAGYISTLKPVDHLTLENGTQGIERREAALDDAHYA